MNKQVQAGKAKNFSEAFDVVFNRPGASKFYFASWTVGRGGSGHCLRGESTNGYSAAAVLRTAILVRDVPYGTLQLVFFEFFKESSPGGGDDEADVAWNQEW